MTVNLDIVPAAAVSARKAARDAWNHSEHGKAVKRAYTLTAGYKRMRQKQNEQRRRLNKLPERRKIENEYKRQWDKSIKGKASRAKRLQSPARKLVALMRSRSIGILKGKKCAHTTVLLGCSGEAWKKYLENKFSLGMTWQNHGLGPGTWQVDHIVPLAQFNLEIPLQQFKAFRFTNTQPLWHEEHVLKSQVERLQLTARSPYGSLANPTNSVIVPL